MNRVDIKPFSGQLLKWVGNKQRFSYEIISHDTVIEWYTKRYEL